MDRRETTVAKNEQAVVLTNVGENELYNQMETCREKPAAALDKRAGVRSLVSGCVAGGRRSGRRIWVGMKRMRMRMRGPEDIWWW